MDYITILKPIFEFLIGLGGAVGVFWAAYKFVRTKYSSYKAKKDKELKIVEERDKKLDYIYKELKPNGGGSLKDKINRMDEQLQHNTEETIKNSKETSKNLELTKTIFHRQRWLLDQRNEPIFEADNNGLCVWVNDKYLDVFNTTKERCEGHGWKNLVHIDDRDKVVHLWESSIKDNRAFEAKYKMISENGIIYEIDCLAVKASNDGYIGTLKIINTKPYRE